MTAIIRLDQGTQAVNLLAAADDPEGDAIQVSNAVIEGDASGIRIDGGVLTVLSDAYSRLHLGQELLVDVSFDVLDSAGGRSPQTARITIVRPIGPVSPLPWKDRRLDVSGDFRITAQDALQVINSSAGHPVPPVVSP